MPRPAPPNTGLSTMIDALYYTRSQLRNATRMDHRRSEEDRTFFEAQALTLDPVIAELEPIEDAIRRHDRGPATEAQAAVLLGDVVLDATLRAGNRTMKAELAGQGGLGAEHVFGRRVDDLTSEPMHLEPGAVAKAADRLADVPEFPSKARIEAELRGAATRQEEALEDRTQAARTRSKLVSRAAAAVVRASEALSKIEAGLLDRFPRQYQYVGTFFKDMRPRKRRKDATTESSET